MVHLTKITLLFFLAVGSRAIAHPIAQEAERLEDKSPVDKWSDDWVQLFNDSCIHCHDEETQTNLNLATLDFDLDSREAFQQWVRIYDRVNAGEMPPPEETVLDVVERDKLTQHLGNILQEQNQLQRREVGRVRARRLTKTEYQYTLQDLLQIETPVVGAIPDEVDSGSFDTVGANQRISAVHMDGYLAAADEALTAALSLEENPFQLGFNDYAWLEEWHEKPIKQGGNITRKFDTGIALFVDVDYLTQFQLDIKKAGRYRFTANLSAIQTKAPLTAKLILKRPSGSAELLKAVELSPDKPYMLSTETLAEPGDRCYVTLDIRPDKSYPAIAAAGGSKNYRGPGLAIYNQMAEGPLNTTWPPTSTQKLLAECDLISDSGDDAGPYRVVASDGALQEAVTRLAPQIYRRAISSDEIVQTVQLGLDSWEENGDYAAALSVSLRSMLCSTDFLMFGGTAGKLDDFSLATRLSYFLWKSAPDEELMRLATLGNLSSESVLLQQVDRMLADPKAARFIKDFTGQWLRLNRINATTPDEALYPEFDELLANALRTETEMYFQYLVDENLSIDNLIDSDFTFLNRRLAEHYEIEGVIGSEFRKVRLPEDSPRGGLLTQASILKTTANGTVTSPVTRGNFVLTNILGTPPAPPPPAVGSIEPDTRGKTTIREILAAHRTIDSCNQCHQVIDPPGFALESFDPIGGYREHYRALGKGDSFFAAFSYATYHQGPAVDPSGTTSDGRDFSDIQRYKQILLEDRETIARNFVSTLTVYATGGEIEFADRGEIAEIMKNTRENGYPVRDIIHQIVLSSLFTEK